MATAAAGPCHGHTSAAHHGCGAAESDLGGVEVHLRPVPANDGC
jgi:hypothetical protein